MAMAITVPTSVEVGEVVDFSISGATASGELDFAAYGEGLPGLSINKVKLAADASGDFASAGQFDIVPGEEGHINITITDVTGAETVTERIEVFRSV